MTADLIIGSLATVISCILLLPQIARLLRTGRTEGVSPAWAALGTVVNGGWLVFVIAERLWVPIISIVGTGAGFGLTLCLLHRKGADVGRGLGVGGAVIVALVAVGGLSGWAVLGTSLALANIVQFFPSVATAWRTYAPVGLSPVTWMLMLAETAGWTAYGVLVDQMPIVLYGLSGLVASMLMLMRIWITRARDSTRVSDRLSVSEYILRPPASNFLDNPVS